LAPQEAPQRRGHLRLGALATAAAADIAFQRLVRRDADGKCVGFICTGVKRRRLFAANEKSLFAPGKHTRIMFFFRSITSNAEKFGVVMMIRMRTRMRSMVRMVVMIVWVRARRVRTRIRAWWRIVVVIMWRRKRRKRPITRAFTPSLLAAHVSAAGLLRLDSREEERDEEADDRCREDFEFHFSCFC
jgi:hypothetical protein